jgi:hypothetical protein
VSPAGLLRADLLRLRSAAPAPLARAAAPPGRVVDPGSDGRGLRDGVRVALREPAWLVLGESFNEGWRARCDGRDLGAPRPVGGYANGWRAPRDCRDVDFEFDPQRTLTAGFAISGVTCALLLALLAVGGWRRRGETRAAATIRESPPPTPGPLPLRWALAVGVAAALVGGFLFAVRAGVVIGPAVALLLLRGVGAGPLALVAGVLTAAVLPAIYLLFPPGDSGGFNSDYANDLLGAHWVAVAAWVLLALALSRAIPRRRAAAPPAADGG